MAEKRKHVGDTAVVDYRPGNKKQKQKGGFKVGPANLPDGVYKRKSMSFSFSPPCAHELTPRSAENKRVAHRARADQEEIRQAEEAG